MTNHQHERAEELIMRRGAEEIAVTDGAWLESHLSQCSECAAFAESFEQTGAWLRSFSITASSSLVMVTQSRVRARAEQMREQQARTVLIAISFCVGVLASTASAWVWWRVGDWVVQLLGLPQSIVAPGVLLFWLLPAIAVAVLLLVLPPDVLERPLMLSLAREREGEIR